MQYRLLFLKPDHRRTEHGVQFEGADDEQAINFVLKLHDDGPKELWCGARRVSTFRARSVERPQATTRGDTAGERRAH